MSLAQAGWDKLGMCIVLLQEGATLAQAGLDKLGVCIALLQARCDSSPGKVG